MQTEFGFIIEEHPEVEISDENAELRASIIVRDSNDWFGNYYSGFNSPQNKQTVVELDTEHGRERAKELLEKTVKKKSDLLQDIIDIANEQGVEEAATNRTVFHNARRMGSWRQPSGHLIDGGSYSHAEPVLNENRLNKIISNNDDSDRELYLITVKAKH